MAPPPDPPILLPPSRPGGQNDQVGLQTAAHNPSDQMVLLPYEFFLPLSFFLKVSCESATSYIGPVLPARLLVIKGHIIRLSRRQKDGKGLRVEWTILHLTRGHESGHFFCTTRCPIRGKQRRVLRFIMVCSATEMIHVMAAPDLI